MVTMSCPNVLQSMPLQKWIKFSFQWVMDWFTQIVVGLRFTPFWNLIQFPWNQIKWADTMSTSTLAVPRVMIIYPQYSTFQWLVCTVVRLLIQLLSSCKSSCYHCWHWQNLVLTIVTTNANNGTDSEINNHVDQSMSTREFLELNPLTVTVLKL